MKSVFLTPEQIFAESESLRGRHVGIVLFKSEPLDEKRLAQKFKSENITFLGMSSALSLANPPGEASRIQMATARDSARTHTAICDATGRIVPYRLVTEPGRLYWEQSQRRWMNELTEELLQVVSNELSGDTTYLVSQNELSSPPVTAGYFAYIDWLGEKRKVACSPQVWISTWSAIAPGNLLGFTARARKMGLSCEVGEFGIQNLQSPYPANLDAIAELRRWEERKAVGWLLTTGLGPEDCPVWGPLTKWKSGPYTSQYFGDMMSFDLFWRRCYDECAARGGPLGVGTDFIFKGAEPTTGRPPKKRAARKKAQMT